MEYPSSTIKTIFSTCLEQQQDEQQSIETSNVEIIQLDDIQRARILIINLGFDPNWMNWPLEQSNSIPSFKYYRTGFFYGELMNKMRHGKGILYTNQSSNEKQITPTQIKQQQRTSSQNSQTNRLVKQKKSIYAGDWQNDRKHGKGKETFANGDIFEGDFFNGKPCGYGSYVTESEIYKGYWLDGYKHGQGKLQTKNLPIQSDDKSKYLISQEQDSLIVQLDIGSYEGEFQNSLKHGKGKEYFQNGDIYEGEYVNGKPNGSGQYIWKDQSLYSGEFCGGLRHGFGQWQKNKNLQIPINQEDPNPKFIMGQKFIYSDCYKGDYINDKKCGSGIFRWASGCIYDGEYFDDLRHGLGIICWPNGSYYDGQWDRGLQCGKQLTLHNKIHLKNSYDKNTKEEDLLQNELHFSSQKGHQMKMNMSFKGQKIANSNIRESINDNGLQEILIQLVAIQTDNESYKLESFLSSKNKSFFPFVIRTPTKSNLLCTQKTSSSFIEPLSKQDQKRGGQSEVKKIIIHHNHFRQRTTNGGQYSSFQPINFAISFKQ